MSLALSTADRAALIARHKTAIDGSLRTRIVTLAVIGSLAGLFVYGLGTLETSFARIFAGFANLGMMSTNAQRTLQVRMHPRYWQGLRLER